MIILLSKNYPNPIMIVEGKFDSEFATNNIITAREPSGVAERTRAGSMTWDNPVWLNSRAPPSGGTEG